MSEPDDFDDDRYEDDDPCDHDDRDVDILTGRANCWRCGESWWLTDAELKREIELQAQMWVCFEEESATPKKQEGAET